MPDCRLARSAIPASPHSKPRSPHPTPTISTSSPTPRATAASPPPSKSTRSRYRPTAAPCSTQLTKPFSQRIRNRLKLRKPLHIQFILLTVLPGPAFTAFGQIYLKFAHED